MNNLLKSWDACRIIRLMAGVGVGIYAVVSEDYMFLMLAGLFLFQALLNISCCGAGGCSTSDTANHKQVYKGEIKTYNPNKK